MVDTLILEIKQDMATVLTNGQLEHLNNVLVHYLYNLEIRKKDGVTEEKEEQNEGLLKNFLSAKHVEGCSKKSLKYYSATIKNMLNKMDKSVKHITTNDLREYLDKYQRDGNTSKVTIDNIRRIFSSFFSWLEEEDHILKSPVRRIHKVKTGTVQKWPVPVLHYSSDSVSVACVSWEGSSSVSAVSDAALFRCTYPRSDTGFKSLSRSKSSSSISSVQSYSETASLSLQK